VTRVPVRHASPSVIARGFIRGASNVIFRGQSPSGRGGVPAGTRGGTVPIAPSGAVGFGAAAIRGVRGLFAKATTNPFANLGFGAAAKKVGLGVLGGTAAYGSYEMIRAASSGEPLRFDPRRAALIGGGFGIGTPASILAGFAFGSGEKIVGTAKKFGVEILPDEWRTGLPPIDIPQIPSTPFGVQYDAPTFNIDFGSALQTPSGLPSGTVGTVFSPSVSVGGQGESSLLPLMIALGLVGGGGYLLGRKRRKRKSRKRRKK